MTNDLIKGIADSNDEVENSRAPRSADRGLPEKLRQERPVTYRPPSDLEIPQEVIEAFLNKGFKLRWIRFQINGETDQANLFRHQKEGAQFVKPEEVTSMELFTQNVKLGSDNLVTVGDLALAKIPLEWVEARRDYYAQQSAAQLGTIKRELMKGNTRAVPIEDTSKTVERTGKNAHFASD